MARGATKRASELSAQDLPVIEGVLLYCPVRGALGAKALAKDGLTPTEEARRVDFLNFLVDERNYPIERIRVEVVTIKNLGESGRNQLRADVIVYDCPWSQIASLDVGAQLGHAILVAEIKRDSTKKSKGITYQLEPALRVLPRLDAVGVYWDDESRILFTKLVKKQKGFEEVTIKTDSIANLPDYGIIYQAKAITVDTLTKPANLVGTLQGLANVMRSHGVNDGQQRYRETVKLLLARYVDEKSARVSANKQLKLQVLEGADPGFMARVQKLYTSASIRYNRVKTLFSPRTGPDVDENTLRDLVKAIEGFDFSSVSSDTMQQVFMTFVPVVFKRDLSQYFTPASLIDTMVQMVAPGPTEKIADPAMGTADFLTSAMNYCIRRGDDDALSRIYGTDSDSQAYDLAIINMILNRDGQANLRNEDSIEHHLRWAEEMDVVLCNPPFGSETVERRPEVLKAYDLGHVWAADNKGVWKKTSEILKSQQIGILFIERCWKMLRDGGRLAIILPEGYLATAAHKYVRQWMLDHFVIRSLVELPRRIFVKSGADLRSNIMVAEKRNPSERVSPYPIHASMVRRVGYKLGGDFRPLSLQDKATGLPIRDSANKIVLDSDFRRVLQEFGATPKRTSAKWNGATVTDVISHKNLDMKPRRLVPRALQNMRDLKSSGAVPLSQIASVVDETIDLLDDVGVSDFRRVVEGQDIRAIEGIVVPHFQERCWSIAERKQRKVYQLQYGDLIVGLVRPERRNIGILLDDGNDVVGSPDGLAVVRVKEDCEESYPAEWLFATLRSEQVRLQLWTESGGTSYGKLDADQIRQVLIPVATESERKEVAVRVQMWIDSVRANSESWAEIGIEGDRRPILNSPLTGLFDDSEPEDEPSTPQTEDERDAEIARKRLTEIKENPGGLVQGDQLRDRLAGIKP
jgi:type I restriction enzyme M protein